MTNYFLTTTFGRSKTISPIPFHFIWFLRAPHSLNWGGETCCCCRNLKHMSPIHFTHMEYYYVFTSWRARERGLAIDAEWNVIALLLQLSVRGEKQPFEQHKMFPKTLWLTAVPDAHTPLPHQSILTCTITLLLPYKHRVTQSFQNVQRSPTRIQNTWLFEKLSKLGCPVK